MERILGLFRRRKFQMLLVALGLLIVAYPLMQNAFESRLVLDALLGLVLLAALHVVFRSKRLRLAAIVLGLPALIGVWARGFLRPESESAAEVLFHGIAAAFFFFAVIVIIRMVHREKAITADSVCGVLCGYLLVGLLFGHIYCVVDLLEPHAFRLPENLAPKLEDDMRRHFLLTYFSFITLTTVGYGVITPSTGAARSLVVVEAILGQFYIAVLIAELIGKRVAQAIKTQEESHAAPDN
jgi:voltage-gated potassium channel